MMSSRRCVCERAKPLDPVTKSNERVTGKSAGTCVIPRQTRLSYSHVGRNECTATSGGLPGPLAEFGPTSLEVRLCRRGGLQRAILSRKIEPT
jgi:hypothetical protein